MEQRQRLSIINVRFSVWADLRPSYEEFSQWNANRWDYRLAGSQPRIARNALCNQRSKHLMQYWLSMVSHVTPSTSFVRTHRQWTDRLCVHRFLVFPFSILLLPFNTVHISMFCSFSRNNFTSQQHFCTYFSRQHQPIGQPSQLKTRTKQKQKILIFFLFSFLCLFFACSNEKATKSLSKTTKK